MYALLEVFSNHHRGHPHRVPFGRAVEKVLRGQAPDDDDLAVIVQGFATDPIMDTMDLQEVIDEINDRFSTSYTIHG
ncbi:hypothetical protein [Vibrio phage CKB-S1]|nr:hypothetical protein [Vibrio phage CKB-S1]